MFGGASAVHAVIAKGFVYSFLSPIFNKLFSEPEFLEKRGYQNLIGLVMLLEG